MSPETVRAHLRQQAAFCARSGSAFSGQLLAAAAADDAWGKVLAPWRGATEPAMRDDAVGLRLLGACHARALSGDDLELAAIYPTDEAPGAGAAAWALCADRLRRDPAFFARFVADEPQTNEVGRSAALIGGFLTVAAATGLPLRTFELGASAGLNQLWDRFAYRTDAFSWGDPASVVVLTPRWNGPSPPLPSVEVLSRAACERRPVDLSDPAQRQRLRAFVWADQRERLSRLDAAIGLALASGVTVERADAVAWVRDRVTLADGAATVLYHSVFLQYLSTTARDVLNDLVATLGAAATPASPFAWLRLEAPVDALSGHEVRLTLWPGGEDRLLARAHPHGAWVEWLN